MNVRNPVRVLLSRISIRHSAVKPCGLRMPQPFTRVGPAATSSMARDWLVLTMVRKIIIAVATPTTPNPTTGACHDMPTSSDRLTIPPNANFPTSPKKL